MPLILTAGHGKSDKITPYDSGHYTAADGSHIRFIEDYYATLTDMYIQDYISDMQRWANEKFKGTYRAQAYNTTGMKSRMNLDTPRTALVVGISEGESLNFATNYDRFRGISGGVNISGKQLISDEVLALMPRAYDMPFSESIATINRDFSVGVNHMVVHGISTARASDEYDGGLWSQWPGWHAFGAYVADSWSARQPYYEDLQTMNDYMARLQAVMQNGQPKIDLLLFAPNAFVGDGDTSDNRDRPLLREALDKGFTYDLVSEDALLHSHSIVHNGVLIPNGPGYKALVVYDAPGVSIAAASKMKEYAEAGLPILFIGGMPHRVLGISGDVFGISARQTEAELAAVMDELADNDHVYVIDSIADLAGKLAQINLKPAASYDFRYMRNLRRVDNEGTSYYYLYNNAEEDADVQVALEGDGLPYKLNCWNGDMTPITEYDKTACGLVLRVQLESTESVIIALTHDTGRFGAAPALSVTELGNGEVVFKDGKLHYRAPQSGQYDLTLSDGTHLSMETTVPEAISMNEGWTFELESWGPFDDYSDKPTTLSQKTAIVFENFTLTSWKEIHADDEQIRTLQLNNIAPEKLAALGGNPMGSVAGVGRYKKTFVLPKLGTCEGYYLKFSHGHDQVTRIIVIGRSIGALDQSKSIFDIGRLLTEGSNTIEITLSTTLNNRLKIEYVTPDYWKEQMKKGIHYETDHPRYGGLLFEKSTVRPYGLTAVSLIPYSDSELK
ncbi:glycosyl hydrolase [Paenibacillus sp. TAB 01]|uniref:glycosyl hydrolase n=1 Tax=Paenibacillus sp. TAB 01 TaxID=3368988 RepID=UPI0037524137